ncbi:polysaccharide deacetylase family protein [Adlercreutzia sp. R7]|uniref:Polysaccharide deacetylase family protein n=1 Tax=Adlercreutzia wanghongyangiae TaxID=3111451 RepID=A0ABU6IH41_9ACTN|nr:polysaccharide deacetylase family protein [Adlercreutzia sp. R7]
MPDQPMPASGGANNPRNNPRNHRKPVRRHDGAAPSAAGAAAAGGVPPTPDAARVAPGQDAAAQEAAARAAYEQYAAATAQPHPAAPAQTHPSGPVPPQYGSRYQQQGGYAGYAQSAAGNPRVMPAHKVGAPAAPYADFDRYKKKGNKKKAGIISLVLVAVLLVGGGVGAYLYLNPPTFNVTVNGMTRTVNQGTTTADIVADGVVSPKAGNLVAVDGEVLEEGSGTPFGGTVNGNEITDTNMALHKGDTVQIVDGSDITEDYDTETVETAPGQAELGQGAIHVYIPGEAGQTEKRTGKVSGKTVEEVVKPVQNNVYLQYDANPGDEKVVALTFDDGPWATTSELLDVLKEYDVKATFFTIGEQIADQPNTMKQMAEAGHQIATHSWDHAAGSGRGVDMTRMSTEEQIAEVQKGQQAITDATGQEASKVFRSPGGNYHDEIIWTLQPYVTAEIGWNVDTEDWRRPGVDAIVQRIESVKSGDIVLMHDGGGPRTQTIEALKIALPYLKEQGFKFVTIDELMAYDDVKAIAQSLEEGQQAQ